jgi:hypothetical protein
MKEYIGKEVTFIIDGVPRPFTGTVLSQSDVLVTVKSKSDLPGRVFHIPKRKIAMFSPVDGESEYIPFQVLYCNNKSIGCDGVQFIKAGEGITANDFNAFMGDCPLKCDTCKQGKKKELRSVDSGYLNEMLNGTIFGDYPEVKK